jgi:hypothetical protein
VQQGEAQIGISHINIGVLLFFRSVSNPSRAHVLQLASRCPNFRFHQSNEELPQA